MSDQNNANTNETSIVKFPEQPAGSAAQETLLDEASHWIVKLEGDQPPSAKEQKALQVWMAQSPQHKRILLSMASHWNDMDLLSSLMVSPPQSSRANSAGLMATVASWLMAPLLGLGALIVKAFDGSPRYALASTVLAISIVSGVVFVSNDTSVNALYATIVGEQATHTLKDQSVLHLNTNSQVQVEYSKDIRRLTLLQGEVHFEVSPDKARPFEVYAGNRLVRAVGTAFSVRLDKDRVRVVVSEGIVDLAVVKAIVAEMEKELGSDSRTAPHADLRTKPAANINVNKALTKRAAQNSTTEVFGTLKAGESIEIPVTIKGVMNAVEYHDPKALNRQLAWIEGKLVFDGEPLENVVREVSRYTSIEIELVDARLKTLLIGGQFQIGETDALLDVLQTGFGLKVSRISESHVQILAP